ncbi:MAG: phosphohistidine phosphatase SixA [Isosphaeraceae bacterium]
MTRLYLLRHGTAHPARSGQPDDSRELSPVGIAEMEDVAKGLRRLKVDPQRIVSSPLPRALRTAEIVAERLGALDHLEINDLLRPDVPLGQIRDWLDSRSEDRLMLVGHNPGLSQLIGRLLGPEPTEVPIELKKGGIAALRSDQEGRFDLQWITTPKLIRLLLGS